MKSLPKILFALLILTACGRSGEKKDGSIGGDSTNQILYDQVMVVHDSIMPKMEDIYNLKKDIAEKAGNTANAERKKQLAGILSQLDTANNTMIEWMHEFNPLPDSVDKEMAREYLESELERVINVRDFITETIKASEEEINKDYDKKNKVAKEKTSNLKKEIDRVPVTVKPVDPEVIDPIVVELPKKDSSISRHVATIDSSSIKTDVVTPIEKKPVGKPFYFKLVNAESGKEVAGEVHIVESKAAQYQGFKANQLVYLVAPKNSSGAYQATIQAPGYKPAKVIFNYKDPSAVSSGIGEKQETIVTFDLIPAKKGDYIDFNNVRFFRNSTILEPGSRNELDGLADLMKEKSKYKIKIHGHSNGDESRDIITLGSSTNIFALDPALNKKEKATAMRLTELRAEAVENYLVSLGIAQERISLKGQGGKMMIYPRTSTLANYNDRVEIEVLKGK